jgi:hypothetical protein
MRNKSHAGSLLVVLMLATMSLLMVATSASAAGNANFVGIWNLSNGGMFTVTGQSPSGACTLAPGGEFSAQDCQVSGNSYSLTVVEAGSSYESFNTGTIDGNTLTGSFTDTNGTTQAYTGTRAPTISVSVSLVNSAGVAWSPANQGPNRALVARLKVTNLASAVTSVVPTITVAPSASLTPVGGLSPAGGGALAAGASQTYSQTYTVTGSGPATLSATVSYVDSYGNSDTTSAVQTIVNLGTVVSGQIQDIDCGDATSDTCALSALPGMPVVVVGTGSDGTAVDETTTTADDGTWSLNVPSGAYAVGPSADGQTIAAGGFDPEQYPSTTVGSTPVPNLNFTTCTDDDTADATASLRAGLPFTDQPTPKFERAGDVRSNASSSSFSPSDCKSYYTFTLSAQVPEAHIVDPSLDARFQTTGFGGYNNKRNTLGLLEGSSVLHSVPEFPACLSDANVVSYTAKNVRASWYTYIQGGSLGHATVTLQWNRTQTTQEVHVVDPPDETDNYMIRWFVYRLTYPDGHTTKGRCFQREPVDILPTAISGADDPDLGLPSDQFVILATWNFPFDAPGVKIDENGSIVQSITTAFATKTEQLISWYHSLPKGARATLNFLVAYALGSAKVAAVAKAPALIEGALSGTKFVLTAAQLKKLEVAGEIAHALAHGKHNIDSASELLESIVGYLGEEESGEPDYPIMSALIRGRFQTAYLQNGGKNLVTATGNVPIGSVLALHVFTTKFPTISLSVTRNALSPSPTATDTRPVYNGPIPWATGVGSPAVSNPFFNHFEAPNILADATKTGHTYAIGEGDVKNVIADTSQLPRVSEGLRNDAELVTGITDDLTEDDAPTCSTDNPTESTSSDTVATICWLFKDNRP